MPVGFGVRGIFTQHVQRGEMAMLHGLKHIAQMPAAFGLNLRAPGFLKLGAQLTVLDMLEAGKTVRNRAHISTALDVVLSAQGIYSAAVAAHMPAQQCEVDKGFYVVDSVVMLGDSESPAELRPRSAGVRMRHLADAFSGHAGLTLGACQRVFL